ncbi:MAG: tannase/feruloyl esterase family alpha/beta hydrolase [Pseudomonas sp.]|uniref:tannase/feruloyl esterase family alpha/beta hydrolase n=1 Tax=Pseudomonas sp. TaxID=306 RepID=UPI0030F26D4D
MAVVLLGPASAWAGVGNAVVKPVAACASLASVDLSDIAGQGSRISSASDTLSNGIAVCTVQGTLAPSIGFTVLLPTQTWTQRYLQVGCGGLCGRISLEVGAAEGCTPLTHGEFAMAATNMGHQDGDETFGDDAQKRADFAHRAVHLTAVAAKKLIQQFYGQPQQYAYFTGCSDGGREALMEAQRYPQDFNGIIAGAAALNFQVQNGLYHPWQVRANQGPDGKAILLAARLPLLHQAVLKQCDALDGQTDQLLTDPRACHFDPKVLLCADGQAAAGCFSTAEVAAAQRLYDGPRDSKTGARLTVGGPQPGSELAWAGVFVPASAEQPVMSQMIALQALRGVLFEHNPASSFSLADLTFTTSTFERLRTLHPLYDATNPDLSAFEAAGGKLILWHGWADPHISPLNTIAYHQALQTQMGESRSQGFERLYLLPGVYHCSGGEGPSQLDLLTPMLAWVEAGQAPQAITTTQASADQQHARGFGAPVGVKGPPPGQGKPPMGPPPVFDTANQGRTRPVYPYPLVAVYDGHGDPKQASSYRPERSPVAESNVQWLGADFFTPYAPSQR